MNTNISLRPARVEDAENLAQLINDNLEYLKNFSMFQNSVTVEEERRWLAGEGGSGERMTSVIMAEGRIIGTVGLNEVDRSNLTARLGLIIFSPTDRSKGYGTEAILRILQTAFVFKGFNQIYVTVFAENDPAHEHYRKVGFVYRGLLPKWYRLKGEFHDMEFYSMLLEEWEEKYGAKKSETENVLNAG